MGVPKFYRWISERYPCLSEVIREFQIPVFDNLYLDMNGIIHLCSHPEDDNPHFRITEEDIFIHIFQYIEFLFQMIKPCKVFFMAIDGVAPRAKMNQQRGRRFRSAREAENLINQAKERGEVLPTEKRFDSNCITPGTEFMVRLQKQLQFFVTQKVSSDPLWKGVDIYLSGHETPGEGEHKIMDYIRSLRSKPDYDPNTRHCVYGLDADLILLGLTSHEPHFSLLREEVRFGGKRDKTKRPMTPKETTFLLLHLSLMREYLYFEFADLEHKLSFPFDLERIIDDWIFMSFLVGNDFIPHLPHLHIHQDGLPFLWQTYMQVLPTCDGYLTDAGSLNLERFEKYITALSKVDFEKFQETTANAKWLSAKSTRGRPTRPKEIFNEPSSSHKNKAKYRELEEFLMNDSEYDGECLEDNYAESKVSEAVTNCDQSEEESFWEYKKDYYKSKLQYEEVTDEVLKEQAYIYISALQWNLYYYFDGCQSWSWYYPHHYAPFMSDLVNIKDIKIKLDMGRPFLPFQQLMAVLPSASKELLPPPLQELMTKQSSPIQKYYPEDFETDLNGKLHEWEAVVLIPFIDETELLKAMATAEDRLSPSEKARNRHSPHQLYQYSSECLEKYPSTLSKLPDVHYNHALCTYVPLDAFHTPVNILKKSLLTNDKQNVYFPGFPTFKHIRHRAELKKDGVKVFQFNSKLDNMIVQIIEDWEQDLKSIATDILGKTLLVNWPHLFEVKVLVVADAQMSYYLSNHFDGTIRCEKLDELHHKLWQREVNAITEKYHSTRGIEIGPTSVLIRASPVTGRKYVAGPAGKITLQKQFSEKTMPYALQATVRDIISEEPEYSDEKTIDEVFTVDTSVFMLSGTYYGFHGKVSEVNKDQCTVSVSIPVPYEPNLDNIIHNQQLYEKRYYSASDAAMRLGISNYFLSHITESVFVVRNSRNGSNEQKVNIGLGLKVHRRSEAPGYTKFMFDTWHYSEKTLDCVHQYLQRFPELFEIISTQGHSYHDALPENKVFSNLRYTLQNVIDFIKTLPCRNIKLLKSGSMVLNEGVVEAIANVVRKLPDINKNVKTVSQTVKPDNLFKPIASVSNVIPDSNVEYKLFDRIINIRKGLGTLPFGLRGTVVGVHPGDKPFSTIYDILFDEEFSQAVEVGNVPNCGYHLTIHDMMNLSHGKHQNQPTTTSPFPARTSQYANQNQSARPTYSGNQTQRKVTVNNQNNSRRDKSSGVNEFADIWKELKQLKVSDPPSCMPPQARKANRSSSASSNSCSLSHAAQALDKLSDSMTAANAKAEFGGGRDENGNGRLAGGSRSGGRSGGGHKNRLTVSTLFQQAVESEPKGFLPTNSAGPDSGPVSATSGKGKAKGNKMGTPSSMPAGNAEDGTAALKQMLNIGNTESAPYKFDSQTGDMKTQSIASPKVQIAVAPSSHAVGNLSSSGASSFTHQVTVEELFEAYRRFSKKSAKEQILPHPNQQQQQCYRGGQQQIQPLLPQTLPSSGQSFNKQPASLMHMHPQRPVTTLPNASAAAYKQPQQRQKGPPPGFVKHQNHKNYSSKLGGCRNTALELHNLCCQYGLGPPKYDFSGAKNHITACVTLSNGNRLQGTPCATRDEAVESTARIALLHLSAQSMMVPYQLMPPQAAPPGIMPATHLGQMPQQFSSPNSAFSPVVPRGPAPGWGIVPQHLQKLPWYTTQANLNSGGSAAPTVLYPGTAGNQFATKQAAIVSTPLVSTTLTPSQVHTSLSCSVANGSTSNSEKSKSVSQSSKGSHGRSAAGAPGRLPNDPSQHQLSAPSSQTDRPHVTPAVVSSSTLGTCSTSSQKVTATTKKPTSDGSKSSKPKETDSNSATTTAPCINNNLNSTPTKSNHKKKRSRLAANFCTSSSTMAKN
ncbi:5'-3' exoribonuclease 1 isoform X4 [Octopus sinensis]|uniref:5'-3' exoribonuclease 1 isoform X4 n=1 Tax=Octopus sinensis TaxID=2607531 RepID=A0A7E6FPQ0_9MOLL|nr:5'-3' exoribonuclease 1 isoform X4 [Octopus sinensis]